MEYLSRNLPWLKFNYWIKPSLGLRRDNNISIVLGENIKEESLRIMPGISVEAVEHPYIANADYLEYSSLLHPVKIGSVGFTTEKKGFSSMFLLEKKLCSLGCGGNGAVELRHIGQIDTVSFIGLAKTSYTAGHYVKLPYFIQLFFPGFVSVFHIFQ
jgi:hypothetical protein